MLTKTFNKLVRNLQLLRAYHWL